MRAFSFVGPEAAHDFPFSGVTGGKLISSRILQANAWRVSVGGLVFGRQDAVAQGLSVRKPVGSFAGICETLHYLVRRRLQWAST